MTDKVKLFKTWASPFGLRIVWALRLKRLGYASTYEDDFNMCPLLLHHSLVILAHNEKPIYESMVILEYIDETWKENPLFPQHPYERAVTRFLVKLVDDKIMPLTWDAFIGDGEQRGEAIKQVAENLKLFEDELKVKGTKYFGGEHVIGVVDLALGWLSYLTPVFKETTDLEVFNKHEFPLLSTWMQQFADVKIIRQTLPPHDQLVTKFTALREMSNPTKTP